jgi:uncharacterized protein
MTTEADPPRAIAAVVEGLFETSREGPRLVGTRCLSCRALYFPETVSCRNPDCSDKQVERALLPDRGTLYSYTIQYYQPPSLFRVDDWAPYAIGLVNLGEGLRVMSILSGIALDAIEIGMPLQLHIGTLYVDPEQGAVATFMFRPADREGLAP